MARSTQDVLNHHLQSFGSGDLNGLLEDYTSESVFMTSEGAVVHGPEQMKGLFQALIAEFAKPGASFSMSQMIVDGEIAFIAWSAETADNVYEMATDTFVVRDSKIVAQTFAAKVKPKR
jgi:ketosteroid isomerase-like protein